MRHRPRLGAALPLALLLAGCVSTRPWRECPRPCPDGQIAASEEVRVVSYDDRLLLIDQPQPGMDEHGHFIAGSGITPEGEHVGVVRVYDDEICWIETRHVEAGRVAANVVLVPLAVTAAAYASYYGVDVTDAPWLIDPQTGPPHCPPGMPRLRQAPAPPPPAGADHT